MAGQDTSSVRRSPFHLAMDRYILRYPQGRARAGEDERPTGTDYQETTEQQHTTTNLNSGNVCICGKVCKNQRGLKIHMGKMGCSPIQSLIRRTGQPGETEEGAVQEENHSDHNLHVLGNEEDTTEEAPNTENEGEQEIQQNTNNIQNTDIESRRKKIKWPNSNAKGE